MAGDDHQKQKQYIELELDTDCGTGGENIEMDTERFLFHCGIFLVSVRLRDVSVMI